jgi:hypothetical protein
MALSTRDAKKYAKARQRRRTAQERLARDRRQAQHAAEVLQQALDNLGLAENLVAEIEGRLRSQQQLLGKCSVREPSIRIWTVYFAKSGTRLLRSHWST